MRSLAAFTLLILMAGCGDSEFRAQPYNKAQALSHTEVLEMKVVKVWSVVGDHLEHYRELGISHYVEVDVVSGTKAGEHLTLPLDDWTTKPPAEGAVVVAAPADWVKQGKNHQTRPYGGW